MGVECPFHRHKHGWRLVDFDRSRKTAFRADVIQVYQKSWYGALLDGLPMGATMEPWD